MIKLNHVSYPVHMFMTSLTAKAKNAISFTSRQLLPESRDRDRLWLEEEEEELILKRRRRGRRKKRRRGGSGGGGTRGEKEDHGQARSTHCSDRSLH